MPPPPLPLPIRPRESQQPPRRVQAESEVRAMPPPPFPTRRPAGQPQSKSGSNHQASTIPPPTSAASVPSSPFTVKPEPIDDDAHLLTQGPRYRRGTSEFEVQRQLLREPSVESDHEEHLEEANVDSPDVIAEHLKGDIGYVPSAALMALFGGLQSNGTSEGSQAGNVVKIEEEAAEEELGRAVMDRKRRDGSELSRDSRAVHSKRVKLEPID